MGKSKNCKTNCKTYCQASLIETFSFKIKFTLLTDLSWVFPLHCNTSSHSISALPNESGTFNMATVQHITSWYTKFYTPTSVMFPWVVAAMAKQQVHTTRHNRQRILFIYLFIHTFFKLRPLHLFVPHPLSALVLLKNRSNAHSWSLNLSK